MLLFCVVWSFECSWYFVVAFKNTERNLSSVIGRTKLDFLRTSDFSIFCWSRPLNCSESRNLLPNSSISDFSSVLFAFGVGPNFRLRFNSFVSTDESSRHDILIIFDLISLLVGLATSAVGVWGMGCVDSSAVDNPVVASGGDVVIKNYFVAMMLVHLVAD